MNKTTSNCANDLPVIYKHYKSQCISTNCLLFVVLSYIL